MPFWQKKAPFSKMVHRFGTLSSLSVCNLMSYHGTAAKMSINSSNYIMYIEGRQNGFELKALYEVEQYVVHAGVVLLQLLNQYYTLQTEVALI